LNLDVVIITVFGARLLRPALGLTLPGGFVLTPLLFFSPRKAVVVTVADDPTDGQDGLQARVLRACFDGSANDTPTSSRCEPVAVLAALVKLSRVFLGVGSADAGVNTKARQARLLRLSAVSLEFSVSVASVTAGTTHVFDLPFFLIRAWSLGDSGAPR